MNWRRTLEFPPEVPISRTAKKTIQRFVQNNSMCSCCFFIYDHLNRFCESSDKRVQDLKDIKKLNWVSNVDWDHIRERPAAIPVTVRSIDDTSTFDEFPDVELRF